PWAQYPWHGQPSDRSFGFGRAGIHNLDAGQEKTLFEALRAEHDTDLTVGDVLRRVHRILQDARPGRRIAVHPDDVIALHQRYHLRTPDSTTRRRARWTAPRTTPTSQAYVPPAQWLDGVPGDERRMALTVGEYVAEHSSPLGITRWYQEVEVPSGHVRKMHYWVRSVRAGTIPLHRATVRYLEAMSFFTAEQLATARERSMNASSITVPSEHLLDGIPDDERILALALRDYVTNAGGSADVTGWAHEVTLSTGQKRVSSWLELVRRGHRTVAGKTADYLKDLSLLNEAHLAKVKKLAPPSADMLDGAPAHERTAALLSAEYIVQHRGDRGLRHSQQPLDFPDGVSWNLGAWVEAVRGGQLAISRKTFQYLEQLPSFFRPGAAADARIAGLGGPGARPGGDVVVRAARVDTAPYKAALTEALGKATLTPGQRERLQRVLDTHRSAEQPANAWEQRKNAPIATPSEYLLDGVPDDERVPTLALKGYVSHTVDIEGITNWRREVTLPTGQEWAGAWLESVRAGELQEVPWSVTSQGGGTVDKGKGRVLADVEEESSEGLSDVERQAVSLLASAGVDLGPVVLVGAE
ncbi:hypothetical protein, partial [Streptomyces violaceorubidus]